MGRFPNQYFSALALAVAILSLATRSALALDDDRITVTSADDGHGVYSYTFSSQTTNFYFTLGSFSIQSHGVLGTTQPPGWTATLDTNELIQWDFHTNQYQPITNALTFTVHSSYPVPRLYNQFEYPSQLPIGFLLLIVYSDPNFEIVLGGGYETFATFGPSTNGAPTLSIQNVDTNLVIGWHAAATNHILELSTDLSQTNWTPLTNIVLIGHSNYVTVPAMPGPQFFRTRSTNAP